MTRKHQIEGALEIAFIKIVKYCRMFNNDSILPSEFTFFIDKIQAYFFLFSNKILSRFFLLRFDNTGFDGGKQKMAKRVRECLLEFV